MQKLKILILDQGRNTLPFVKSFSKSGYHTTVICNTRLCESYFSRYPSKRLIWPSYLEERDAFEKKLMDYLQSNRVDVTISLSDTTADILSKNKDEIIKYTNITLPDYSTFIKGADKLNLMEFCMANNLPCPKTYRLTDDTINTIEDLLKFPLVIKPTRGVGAIGVVTVYNQNELITKYELLKKTYENLIIQEYIPVEEGRQYMAEAFLDEQSHMKVCMVIEKPRIFPIKAGTSSANITVNNQEITNTTKTLLESLNWIGPADVDYMLDPKDNTAKILEINPRVTAGIKIGFVAGIDYADLCVKLALGKEIPEINPYKLNIYSRNFFLEILWYLSADSKMKKQTNPPFFKFFGKNVIDQVFSFDDPFTGLGFFLNMTRKYTKLSNFRKKFKK